MKMVAKMVRMVLLFDVYGELLTPRQRKFFSLHYEQDLSLGEISDEFGITRQAVYDILKRAENSLENYETRLGLVARYLDNKRELDALLDKVNELYEKGNDEWNECLQLITEKIMELLNK